MADNKEFNAEAMEQVNGGRHRPRLVESNEDTKQVKAKDNETVIWIYIP